MKTSTTLIPGFVRRAPLNLKVGVILAATFTLMLVVAYFSIISTFSIFLDKINTDQLNREIVALQQHMHEIEEEVVNAARLLSYAPGLTEAVNARDADALRTTILLQGESLELDTIIVVDSSKDVLLNISGTDVTLSPQETDRILSLALLGTSTSEVITNTESESSIQLVAISSFKDTSGKVIGAVLAGRSIDDSFMNMLNFGRSNPAIALIHNSRLIAQSTIESAGAAVYDASSHQSQIDQAQRGEIWMSSTADSSDRNLDIPTQALAYAPLPIGGQSRSVLAVVNDYQTLYDFQQNLTINNIYIIILVLGSTVTAVILVLSWSVTRPILQLRSISQKIAAGNFQQRVQLRSEDEIGQLAQAFNAMAQEVEHRIAEAQAGRERAETSDKVKSAFLASMSHELRTPLNAVINFTRFVVDGDMGPVNAEQSEMLNESISSAKHLLKLINNILDMSKIESGSLKLFIEDNISMNSILESAVHTGRGLLAGKPVRLHSEIEPDLPLLRGDKQRMLQIVLNILGNACKFTEEGDIHVRARQQDGNILISISDTGPGIAPEDMGSVFEPFQQTKTGLRQGGGTGLGMPIAKNLAEAHGGRLWLESEADKGTTFFITLPVKSAILQPTLA